MFDVKEDLQKQKFLTILQVITLLAVVCLALSEFGGYYLIITTIGTHSRLLRKIAFWLFFAKIVLTKYTKKEFIAVLILSLLGYLNCKYSGNTELILSLSMILSLKNVDLKKVFKACFFSTITMVVILGLLSIFKITGQLEITQNFGRGGVETRYCFGYHHPNQWAHVVFLILLFGALAFWERLDWKRILLLAGVNVVSYVLAASRTAMICGFVLLIFVLFYKYGGSIAKNKTLNYFIALSCALVWPVIVYLATSMSYQFYEKTNFLFTGRLRMAKEYMGKYTPSIWGMQIPDELESGSVLDLGYIRFLLEKGTLVYFLMVVFIIALGIYAVKKEKYQIMTGLVCITLYGIYENIAISMVPANVLMVYLSYIIFGMKPSVYAKEYFKD